MKKIILVFLLLMLGFDGYRLWQNLRGASPAFFNSSQNIVELFNNSGNEQLSPGQNQTEFPLIIPDGFTLSIFAKDLVKARVLHQDPTGTIVVSDMGTGEIVALPNNQRVTSGFKQPHGFLFDNCTDTSCALYVSEVTALWQFDYNIQTKLATNKQKLVDLPDGSRHFTRYVLKDPNNPNRLLISIGSACDVCVEKNPMHGSVQALDLTTKQMSPYTTGLRNAVFLTVRPGTKEVWATEMGRDFLGDELPPDEINILKEGNDYGWPYVFGKNIEDKKFPYPDRGVIRDIYTIPSHIDLPAHSAPLGLTFIPGNSDWPRQYWGNLLVAYHGSWNRSDPTGYKVVRITLDEEGNKISEEDFISGWLDSNTSLGRPVDLLATKNGELYISDDKTGVVYLLKKV